MSEELSLPVEANPGPRKFRELIFFLSKRVGELGNGEKAELRRLNPDQPWSPVFWKLVVQLTGEEMSRIGGEGREESEKRWSAVLSALAQSLGFHRPGAPLGKSLAEAGFHELRFTRLLRARGDTLLDEVLKTARFLCAKAEPFDFRDLAGLIESSDRSWAEKSRMNVARDYYFARREW
jgi:CRISPR type I-E-associated protein CasB/Cse2